jgi:DNA replication protein DnaC
MSTSNKPPSTEQLDAQLAYLKLPFIQEHYADLAKEAAQAHWGYVEFLARLIAGETLLRQERSVQRRIRQARFPVIKTLEQFQWSWPAKINRLQVQELFRLKFIEDKANVIFLAGVGLGKTHLAIALGYAACLENHTVRFTD